MTETKTSFTGLTSVEAATFLETFGPNEIVRHKKISGLWAFLLKFKNPLIAILIFASIISAFLGDWISSVMIVLIVFASISLDFYNTHKSQRAAEALRERVAISTRVLRDGQWIEMPLSKVVPEDTIELYAGDLIPADGRVLSAKDFFLNESALTGESFPVEKQERSEVFLGTSVITGNAVMLVKKTGLNTKYSKIAGALNHQEGKTEFDRGIQSFSFLIMKMTFILVVFIFFTNALLKNDPLQSFLFAAALAVGLTPELLPMIITLNLSKGSLSMSKHGVIVKKLSAIQNFGGMDVLCTDKTGTLTEDKIALVKYVDADGRENEDVFHYAYLSSSFRSGFNNPLDAAVKEFKAHNISGFVKVDEIPFDYQRKRDSVVVENAGRYRLVAKGAPEELLKVCSCYGSGKKNLDSKLSKKLFEQYHFLSGEGFRVLGVAYRDVKKQRGAYTKESEENLVFAGFIAFLDPPKKGVTETLRLLEHHGIEVKIITGDNEQVSQKVARDIELRVKGSVLGAVLDSLNDAELADLVEKTTIFARVSPEQKKRVIKTLQRNGHVVGYLGDGINDAPSLQAADVGISVNNAVDVAKESADLILLHKSLRELVSGVIEGRKTFANTLKYLMMSLSSNFGNMFSMAAASVFLPFLPMLPVQILFNNLLFDTSQFAIPLDNVDQEEIRRPRKLEINFLRKFMLIFGPLSSLFDLLTFITLAYVFSFEGSSFQTGWFLESLATQTFVIYTLRTRRFFRNSKPGKYVMAATLLVVASGWFAVQSKIGVLFKFTPLPWTALLAIAAITVLYLWAVEYAKHKFYRHMAKKEAEKLVLVQSRAY